MRCFVTGCAGFIGSNLVDHLLAAGHDVTGFDNLSTGRIAFLQEASTHSTFRFIEGDVLDRQDLKRSMSNIDIVFHLAANADVRFGVEHPTKDLEQNTVGTVNVLEAMRHSGTKRIVFASTGSVYGEATVIPTPETAPFPVQTSLYAASKLAAEGFISAYCEGFGMQGYIFRFVSILGERYTHGHVFDFYKQLTAHPDYLHVLGDGKQRKSYLNVQDCVSAILTVIERAKSKVVVLNLGTDEYCEVTDSIRWICDELGVEPKLSFTGGDRGWVGDNPFIYLDTTAVRALGWHPKLNIKESVIRTVRYLRQHPELLEAR